MKIITPAFTKSVWGRMTTNLPPPAAKRRIIVADPVAMTTDCSYKADALQITTEMVPFDRVMENTLSSSNLVVDFSQTPLLARALSLKIEGSDFEGQVTYRIEKTGKHRVRQIEQPVTGRITGLMLSDEFIPPSPPV